MRLNARAIVGKVHVKGDGGERLLRGVEVLGVQPSKALPYTSTFQKVGKLDFDERADST